MTGRDEHLQRTIRAELESRDAGAFVHVGTATEPALRYCVTALEAPTGPSSLVALAFDGEEWFVVDETKTTDHPADRLARELRERGVSAPVLSPRDVPHDAALYLEGAGLSLASSDVLDRARATKTTDERDRIERTNAAAGAGVRAGAALLAASTVVEGRLEEEMGGEPVTPERLRRAIDVAIVEAGAFPAGNTVVSAGRHDAAGRGPGEALRAGEPIVFEVGPRGPAGYHASLARTAVVDGEGGPERRAHVAVTSSLRSARAMLAGGERSVEALEADLEAEVLAFGFDDGVVASVSGVGLEPRERAVRGGELAEGSVLRLEAAVTDEWGSVRLADLLVLGPDGPRWLTSPSRSLSPEAITAST